MGRLSLDGSPFGQSLKDAERNADGFAARVMAKLSRMALPVIAVAAVKEVAALGAKAAEAAHEISTLAKKFKLSTDEVQQLQAEADQTGVTFEDLVRNAADMEKTLSRLKGGAVLFPPGQIDQLEALWQMAKEAGSKIRNNVIGAAGDAVSAIAGRFGIEQAKLTPAMREFLNSEPAKRRAKAAKKDADFAAAEEASKAHQATQDRILEATEETARLKEEMELASLTTAQQIERLEAKRDAWADKRANDPWMPGSELAANNELESVRIETAIARLRKQGGASVRPQRITPLTDSLRSVGNFLGGSANSPEMSLLRETNKILNDIKRSVAKGGANFPL